MATNKVQTGLRLNEVLYEKVRAIAAREQRSLNNLVEYVMQKYVEDYERKNGTVQTLDEE